MARQKAVDAGADFAIMMTVAMPREVRGFDYYNDVWVTNYGVAHRVAVLGMLVGDDVLDSRLRGNDNGARPEYVGHRVS